VLPEPDAALEPDATLPEPDATLEPDAELDAERPQSDAVTLDAALPLDATGEEGTPLDDDGGPGAAAAGGSCACHQRGAAPAWPLTVLLAFGLTRMRRGRRAAADRAA
jgi:hypothetical protein